MTDKVNGNYRIGSFLSGQPTWWAFATYVPVYQTNVDTPVVDLPGYQVYATLGTWQNVTVTDVTGTAVTYSSLNTYLNAFYQQQNMNILINTFAGRGNPVQVGASVLPGSINGGNINGHTSVYFDEAGYTNNNDPATAIFGSNGAYNATGKTITIVTISTERNNEWELNGYNNYGGNDPDNTNSLGYNILASNALYGGLDGLQCFDLQSGQVLASSSNSSAAATNSPFATTNTVAPYVNYFNTSSATLTNTMASLNMGLPGGLI